MRPHDQPNGRPVHPECALLDGGARCTCASRWDYWDGTEEQRDRRLSILERLTRRRRTGLHAGRSLGAGPDEDDIAQGGESSFRRSGAHSESGYVSANELNDIDGAVPIGEYDELTATGFWKESEFLKSAEKK